MAKIIREVDSALYGLDLIIQDIPGVARLIQNALGAAGQAEDRLAGEVEQVLADLRALRDRVDQLSPKD
jgi:hypothetical protein